MDQERSKEKFSMAEEIKAVLKKHGINQKQLAERLGRSYVGTKMLIARDMHLSSLVAIANAIGCPVKEFFEVGETGNELKPVAKVTIEDDGSYVFQCPHCGHETRFKRHTTFTEVL